ncbi:hypothetical protein [Microcoleus sp. herbarium14]|uniref:hypothetical protein n=1 Tax=Microcoleus sp. herbarium14 TaxID=3055439 RepID=UPI002FD493A2
MAESGADNDTVENTINALYSQFKDVRNKIKLLIRKNLDGAEPEVTPGYETVTNTYPDIKKLEANLKKRIQTASIPPAPDTKN